MRRKPPPSGRTAHKAAVASSVLTKAITSPRGDHTGTPTAASGSVSKVIGRVARPVGSGDPQVRVPAGIRHEHNLPVIGARRRHLNLTGLAGYPNSVRRVLARRATDREFPDVGAAGGPPGDQLAGGMDIGFDV